MIQIDFTKASGAGNDFVIIDNRSHLLPADLPQLARAVCSRHFGIGGDGLLVLDESSRSHFSMHYYNADGSYGGMCGNGGRCIARFAYVHGLAPAELTFEALDFVYSAFVAGETVRLTMKEPRMQNRNLNLSLMSGNVEGTFIDTGAPHFVMFVDDVDAVDVAKVGKEIRQNALAFPEGTNVNFVQMLVDKSLRLRTFERGVEAETLACGTGSVASGIVAHVEKGLPLPISISVRSGEILKVSATVVGDKIGPPQLEGSAHLLFDGRFEYDVNTHHLASATDLGGR